MAVFGRKVGRADLRLVRGDSPPSAFADAVWASRRCGQWKVTVTSPDGGTRRTLGWGYYALSD